MCREGNDASDTMTSFEMCSRMHEIHERLSSCVLTASLHHNTDKPGSDIFQNGRNVDKKLKERESKEIKNLKKETASESEEIINPKKELAKQKNVNKQLEDRLSKFCGNVHKLLNHIIPEEYYDRGVDYIEEDVQDMIIKIDESTVVLDTVEED